MAIPSAPFWGVREVPVEMSEVFPLLDTHVLFKLHWGGKGVKGEAWERLIEDDFGPRLERMWREQDYLNPRAVYGYFPVNADGDELVFFDPEDPSKEIERLQFPRQPAHDRLCLADYWRPIESGERDVCVLQAVTVGPEVTARCEELEAEGEFAEQLFVHGLGVQTAEGIAEWLNERVRNELGIAPDQGRRYSWGYPACPDQAQHVPVFRMLGAESIGLTLSHGFAVEPEQSTVAIVSHHPQASYFGMKSGRIPPDRPAPETGSGGEVGAAVRDGLGGPYPGRRLRRRELLDRDHPSRPSLACACFAACAAGLGRTPRASGAGVCCAGG